MRSILLVFLCLFVIPANAQSITATDVRTVQQLLKDEGYKTGTVDGSFGPRTSAAIKQYQSDWKISQTGRIDTSLIDRLTGKHESTRPRWQDAKDQNCSFYNLSPRARETISFEGECLDGKANGRGKLVYRFFAQGKPKSDRFEGALIDGKNEGQGIYIWANGDSYEGNWRQDKSDGLGVYKWADGSRYAGYWTLDKAHGQGTYEDADGNTYVGEFRDGCSYNDDLEISVNTTREDCSID